MADNNAIHQVNMKQAVNSWTIFLLLRDKLGVTEEEIDLARATATRLVEQQLDEIKNPGAAVLNGILQKARANRTIGNNGA